MSLGPAGNLTGDLLHALRHLLAVADDVIHIIRQEITRRTLDEIGLAVDTERGRLGVELLLHLAPLLQQHGEVPHKVAETLTLRHRAHDDTHALRHIQLLHDLAQTLPLLRVIDLPRDTELVRERHQHDVTTGQGNVGRDARSLAADGPLGYLHHDIRADGVDVRNVLAGNLLLLLARPPLTLNLLQGRIERQGQGIPEVQEGIFLITDIHEHGLEALLDVLDPALENAADDVILTLALDAVLLQHAVLQQGGAPFQFLGVDDDSGSLLRVALAEPEEAFDRINHFRYK